MGIDVYVCKKCKRELGNDKKLCHDCQNKKDDKNRLKGKRILGVLVTIVGGALIKHFSGSDNEKV